MDASIKTKIYDLGTKEGREEFFADNPWLIEDPKFADLAPCQSDR